MRKKNVVQSLHIQSEGATSQNKLENKLRFKKTGKTETVGIPKAFNPVCTELDSGKLFSEDKKMISEFIFFFSESVLRFLHSVYPTKKKDACKKRPFIGLFHHQFHTTSISSGIYPHYVYAFKSFQTDTALPRNPFLENLSALHVE